MRSCVVLLSLGCLASCTKPSSHETSDRADRPAPETSSNAAGVGDARAPGLGEGFSPSSAQATLRWRGSYHSESATVFVPPEWKGVRWNVPDSSGGLGDGPMTLEVSSGRVSGSLDGPLGPASIDGVVSGPTITANIARRDPADQGYSGTLVGTVTGDGVAGTMNLSRGEASAVRTATFSLSRAP